MTNSSLPGANSHSAKWRRGCVQISYEFDKKLDRALPVERRFLRLGKNPTESARKTELCGNVLSFVSLAPNIMTTRNGVYLLATTHPHGSRRYYLFVPDEGQSIFKATPDGRPITVMGSLLKVTSKTPRPWSEGNPYSEEELVLLEEWLKVCLS